MSASGRSGLSRFLRSESFSLARDGRILLVFSTIHRHQTAPEQLSCESPNELPFKATF